MMEGGKIRGRGEEEKDNRRRGVRERQDEDEREGGREGERSNQGPYFGGKVYLKDLWNTGNMKGLFL